MASPVLDNCFKEIAECYVINGFMEKIQNRKFKWNVSDPRRGERDVPVFSCIPEMSDSDSKYTSLYCLFTFFYLSVTAKSRTSSYLANRLFCFFFNSKAGVRWRKLDQPDPGAAGG